MTSAEVLEIIKLHNVLCFFVHFFVLFTAYLSFLLQSTVRWAFFLGYVVTDTIVRPDYCAAGSFTSIILEILCSRFVVILLFGSSSFFLRLLSCFGWLPVFYSSGNRCRLYFGFLFCYYLRSFSCNS